VDYHSPIDLPHALMQAQYLAGRHFNPGEPGTQGERKRLLHLQTVLKNLGVASVNPSQSMMIPLSSQPIRIPYHSTQVGISWDEGHTFWNLESGNDYLIQYPYNPVWVELANLVYIGYGIKDESEECNDYLDKDGESLPLENAAVVLYTGPPKSAELRKRGWSDVNKRIRLAAEQGAQLVCIYDFHSALRYTTYKLDSTHSIPIIRISSEVVHRLLSAEGLDSRSAHNISPFHSMLLQSKLHVTLPTTPIFKSKRWMLVGSIPAATYLSEPPKSILLTASINGTALSPNEIPIQSFNQQIASTATLLELLRSLQVRIHHANLVPNRSILVALVDDTYQVVDSMNPLLSYLESFPNDSPYHPSNLALHIHLDAIGSGSDTIIIQGAIDFQPLFQKIQPLIPKDVTWKAQLLSNAAIHSDFITGIPVLQIETQGNGSNTNTPLEQFQTLNPLGLNAVLTMLHPILYELMLQSEIQFPSQKSINEIIAQSAWIPQLDTDPPPKASPATIRMQLVYRTFPDLLDEMENLAQKQSYQWLTNTKGKTAADFQSKPGMLSIFPVSHYGLTDGSDTRSHVYRIVSQYGAVHLFFDGGAAVYFHPNGTVRMQTKQTIDFVNQLNGRCVFQDLNTEQIQGLLDGNEQPWIQLVSDTFPTEEQWQKLHERGCLTLLNLESVPVEIRTEFIQSFVKLAGSTDYSNAGFINAHQTDSQVPLQIVRILDQQYSPANDSSYESNPELARIRILRKRYYQLTFGNFLAYLP